MISLVVATLNRANTLSLVASSFFQQELVTEIIFVNDCGTDNSEEILRGIALAHPAIPMKYVRNETRKGIGQSRNVGVGLAVNDYIIFCDDDEYMEKGYAKTCLEKLQKYNAGVISGRRIYMREGETQEQALARFGHGIRHVPVFYKLICEYANSAIFHEDQKIPFTNAIILTRKSTLLSHPFDPYYNQGSNYREESDYQMSLFVNGHDNYITNDCHTFHLPMTQVKTGGARVSLFKRIYWSTYYTNHFYNKYYTAYAKKMNMCTPKVVALACFVVFAFYREYLRPALRDIVIKLRLEPYLRGFSNILPLNDNDVQTATRK